MSEIFQCLCFYPLMYDAVSLRAVTLDPLALARIHCCPSCWTQSACSFCRTVVLHHVKIIRGDTRLSSPSEYICAYIYLIHVKHISSVHALSCLF
jgi:hypothetical protein